MPILTLFFSLIIASIVGIILSTLFNDNGQSPAWVHQVFLSIIGAGVIAAAITKEQLCKLCRFLALKHINICPCQSS